VAITALIATGMDKQTNRKMDEQQLRLMSQPHLAFLQGVESIIIIINRFL